MSGVSSYIWRNEAYPLPAIAGNEPKPASGGNDKVDTGNSRERRTDLPPKKNISEIDRANSPADRRRSNGYRTDRNPNE